VVDHLSGLNEAQREAVTTTEGPLLVLAGAGAGKTRVITHRILEIIRRGTAPERILAITFTNKAAGEMRERTRALLASDRELNLPAFEARKSPFVSTFHSLGLTIIKENARALGFKHAPNIFDRADSLRAMKEALKSIGTEEIEPRMALGIVSRKKGDGITAGSYAEAASNSRERLIAAAWLAYDRALAADGALDFDDLLVRAKKFLFENEPARKYYQSRWPYIHIDEYQDTNHIQAEFAELLIGAAKNICAVGDVDQTIYGWRGAEIANIISFEKKFPGAKTILLEENYRSTKNILEAANQVIVKNNNRPEKNLFTKNADGELLSLYQAFDETDEAGFVARIIGEKMADGAKPKNFCVLYRANFQSRAIEEALLAANIPYQVLGTRFFERREVKDVLSFIRAAISPNSADLARVANVPARGIGKVTLLKILAGKENELTGAIAIKVAGFRALLARIRDAAEKLPPSQLVTFVLTETGMEKSFKEDKLEGTERLENVRELVNLAARYDPLAASAEGGAIEALQAMLESAALQSDQDELKEDTNAVRLMTVHASKGLEFPTVFITGLEEGLFPYEREGDSAADQEEERRLCYVAITRAAEKLFLTYASYRTVFGSKNATIPSQFLSDIPQELLLNESPERLGKTIYLD
jgi:DNA helicase-2/ATP-dependent DNA helicase PcrA